MAVGAMSGFMEQLVAGARSSRDGAVNTLDAIDRRTRAAYREIQQATERVMREHPEPDLQHAVEPERDARFDPEEWDVAGPATAQAHAQPDQRRDQQGDDDEYPQTWLR